MQLPTPAGLTTKQSRLPRALSGCFFFVLGYLQGQRCYHLLVSCSTAAPCPFPGHSWEGGFFLCVCEAVCFWFGNRTVSSLRAWSSQHPTAEIPKLRHGWECHRLLMMVFLEGWPCDGKEDIASSQCSTSETELARVRQARRFSYSGRKWERKGRCSQLLGWKSAWLN